MESTADPRRADERIDASVDLSPPANRLRPSTTRPSDVRLRCFMARRRDGRADVGGGDVLCAARRARVVVLGIPLGRNRARNATHVALLLADDQRPRLLRQAARLVLAGARGDPAYRRARRDFGAAALRDRRTARRMAGDAGWAPPLRPSHRVARRTHPGHQLQLRLFFTSRVGRRRNRHWRIGGVRAFPAQ